MKKLEIIKGTKIEKLTIIEEIEPLTSPNGIKPRRIKCQCDCGNTKNVLLLHFIRGRITSCGCIKKTKQGYSNTKIYRIYRAIHERCNGKTKDSLRYLGRGIQVCEEWQKDYKLFIKWAFENGYKQGLQIDRIDNNKGYSPENCRWVTAKVNNNNRENTFNVVYKGENYAFCLLLEKLGLIDNMAAIRSRIKRGYSIEDAFDKPIKKGKYKKKYDLLNKKLG
jgi:hypothetical protein